MPVYRGYFGASPGSIGSLTDNLRCSGSEKDLGWCDKTPSTLSCEHDHDAGLICLRKLDFIYMYSFCTEKTPKQTKNV